MKYLITSINFTKKNMMKYLLFIILINVTFSNCNSGSENMEKEMEMEMPNFNDTLRFASYNVSMFGDTEGQIASQMENADQYLRYKRIAAVIQRVRPDVLVLMEFDYDETGRSLDLFNEQLLGHSQNGDSLIDYPHRFQIPSNTGLLSGVDLNGDGQVSQPNDAFGFGQFEGQYASAILSMYPLKIDEIRSFQKMLWKDIENPSLPTKTNGDSYYSEEALNVFRLSSKNHMDIPIELPDGKLIHALISHPTPPVFDGAEDRNGKRNHDEIKLWADYINNADYLVDDSGNAGGLDENASFIVFGDQNADPLDGDSYNDAINQLLDHSEVNQNVSNGNLIPASNGGQEHGENAGGIGDPSYDTSFFGLRIDYVLPSSDLEAIASSIFWPSSHENGYELVKDEISSDHLLVWVDIKF